MQKWLSKIAIIFTISILFTYIFPTSVALATEDAVSGDEQVQSDDLANEITDEGKETALYEDVQTSEEISEINESSTNEKNDDVESSTETVELIEVPSSEETSNDQEVLLEKQEDDSSAETQSVSIAEQSSEEVYDREALHEYALNIGEISDSRVRTSSTTTWPFSSYPLNVQAFINSHATRAKKYANAAGLYPSVMLAQAILESGWGTSSLSKSPYHQLFGIKGNNFSGNTVLMPTKEWVKDSNHVNGGYYETIYAEFRVYPSYNEAFEDQARFLTVNTRYKNVFRKQAATYQDATRALQSAGYATDPEYANKLNSLIKRWELDRLDGSISYQSHVQSIGNTSTVSNGQTSGTVGSKLRLESIKINLEDLPNSGVEYRTHVQSYGWQSWKTSGQLSGTVGQGKRLEAIQIKLTGEAAELYDVYYRVHAEHFGWMGWAKNGQQAGTQGYRYRMEALEIQLVPKGQAIDGSTASPFKESPTIVGTSTHVQTDGWHDYVYRGSSSGTIGQAKRLEGIKIKLENQEYSGNIEYQTHVQTIGWQPWKQNDQVSGTIGQARRLEAINIKLTGELANHYDVYYRTHIQTYGWLGWAKNGQSSGSEGKAKRLEAIQVKLVPKGQSAPGSTSNQFLK